MRSVHLVLPLILATIQLPSCAHAQWDLEDSHTTASLRGIHNAGGGVAWASGTNGTVLRTEDGGYLWQTCSMPPGAEKLDFRGIQAWDENNAIVMSSGPGDQSRLYRTTDGCQSWKLLFTNPDKQGFWDAIQYHSKQQGYIFGDPVDGKFKVGFPRSDNTWSSPGNQDALKSLPGAGGFAASNSALALAPKNTPSGRPLMWFGTSGPGGASVYRLISDYGHGAVIANWERAPVPLAGANSSSGVFSLSFPDGLRGVAVGGDYQSADQRSGTAAVSSNGGQSWQSAQTLPGGYRSSVAYDPEQKVWITVGQNGTDISLDDGKNWRPLKPSPTDPPDADKSWNALSLPFVVGSHGRIGRLRTIDQEPLTTKKSAH